MLLDGVHVPLTTPFYPDGRVYLRKLEHNVRRYSLTPVSGLIALGEGSEAALLTDGEQREVLRAVAETAVAEKVLTATLNQAGCDAALALAEHAASLKFDVLLLQPPAELAGQEVPLGTWFRVIADRAPLPCMVAGRCGTRTLDAWLLADIAAHPNVIGLLENSGHISRVVDLLKATEATRRTVVTTPTFTAATARMLHPSASAEEVHARGGFVTAASLAGGTAVAATPAPPAIKTRTKQVGVQILWASCADATEALHAGAAGLATPVAAAVPQAVFEVWAAWKDGDHSLMREKQVRVSKVEQAFVEGGAPLLKAGAELSGYFGGRPRLPLVAPTSSEQEQLVGLLDGMRS